MRIDIGRDGTHHIHLHGDDLGFGSPLLLVHGWPVSSHVWERQLPLFLGAGRRVVSYDRRGFGRSDRTIGGFDYDTLAEDLHRVLVKLDLKDSVLIGFSMGCGEVLRCLGNFGSDRVRSAILISAVPPFIRLGRASIGMESDRRVLSVLGDMEADRYVFLERFMSLAFSVGAEGGATRHAPVRRGYWNDAVATCAQASTACVHSWLTDLSDEVPRIDVPVLIVNGELDQVAKWACEEWSAETTLPGVRTHVIPGAPHAIPWTHARELNQIISEFIGRADRAA